MKWTKEDCPFCGEDGKGWEWNERGSQSYKTCKHNYPASILRNEAKQLIMDIAAKKSRLREIEASIECSIGEDNG